MSHQSWHRFGCEGVRNADVRTHVCNRSEQGAAMLETPIEAAQESAIAATQLDSEEAETENGLPAWPLVIDVGDDDSPTPTEVDSSCEEAIPALIRAPIPAPIAPACPEEADSDSECGLSQALEEIINSSLDEQRCNVDKGSRRTHQPAALTVTVSQVGSLNSHRCWEHFWAQLVERGWRIEYGPRGDCYYMPPGVQRSTGTRNRVDYFDSKLQVLRKMRDAGAVMVQVASEDERESSAQEKPISRRLAGLQLQKKSRRVASPALAHATGWDCSSSGRKRPRELPSRDSCLPQDACVEPQGIPELFARHAPWHELWAALEAHGWSLAWGPKGHEEQIYYMPPGIRRGVGGAKVRIDYFDSKQQVLRHMKNRVNSRTGVANPAQASREFAMGSG
mmetsp:Transcript_76614/g.135611  ORF Transcript_76614/g.135611 Transcript_76614/m.135611 type:complete len:393 (+) Transcript_76614:84-1262(+)